MDYKLPRILSRFSDCTSWKVSHNWITPGSQLAAQHPSLLVSHNLIGLWPPRRVLQDDILQMKWCWWRNIVSLCPSPLRGRLSNEHQLIPYQISPSPLLLCLPSFQYQRGCLPSFTWKRAPRCKSVSCPCHNPIPKSTRLLSGMPIIPTGKSPNAIWKSIGSIWLSLTESNGTSKLRSLGCKYYY